MFFFVAATTCRAEAVAAASSRQVQSCRDKADTTRTVYVIISVVVPGRGGREQR